MSALLKVLPGRAWRIVAIGLCASLSACDGGTGVHGTVVDARGKPIPGAAVSLELPERRVDRRVAAQDGTFIIGITHDPRYRGPVTLRVAAAGYRESAIGLVGAGSYRCRVILTEQSSETTHAAAAQHADVCQNTR